MRTRRRFYAALTISLAGLAAAGCSSSSSSPASYSTTASTGASAASSANLSSVTLNVGDQKGTGAQAILAAAGLLDKLPFKVNWSDFTSGPTMVQAMGTGAVDIGAVDIGGVGDAPPVFAASGGENIVIVGARTTDGDQDAIVVPKNSPVHSIAQLKGKKVAVSAGSSDNYHLLTVLNKNGLTTKDITMVNLQPAPGLAAFSSGSIDAWDIWPPYVQQLTAQYGGHVIQTGPSYGSPYSYEVASKAAVANPVKAAAIRVFLKTLNQGYRWTATHPEQWGAAWGEASGLPTPIMVQAAKVSATTPIQITDDTIKSEQGVVDQFYAAGLIPNKVDIHDYMTDRFNDTVGSSA